MEQWRSPHRRQSWRIVGGLLLGLAVLLSACTTDLDEPPSPVEPGPERRLETVVQTLNLAFQYLQERYAEPVDSGALFRAANRGLRQGLWGVGLLTADVRDLYGPDPRRNWQVFHQQFLNLVLSYGQKTPPQWLAHRAIRAAAASLNDCHTVFLDPQQYAEQLQRLSGQMQFGGIGVILGRREAPSPLVIAEVFDDSPAARAGLQPGDVIEAVDSQPTRDLETEALVQRIRGAVGTPVRLTIRRERTGERFEVTLLRAPIRPPVLRSQVLPGPIGYIRIYSFPQTLPADLDTTLQAFDRQRVRALILDLRDNSGGDLQAVTASLSRFVRAGPLFHQVARTGERTTYQATQSYWLGARPLVVLVNQGTGSGGEIFAAAIQEHGTGRVVGTRTAGCVSTGQVFRLPDGSALEIATARVLTGLGQRELNRVGVQPDDEVPMTPADLAAGHDPQLDRARTLLGG